MTSLRDEFAEQGATLYGVSCDSVWSQAAFKEKLGIEMEQLSDFEPKGATCTGVRRLPPGRVCAARTRDRRA